MEHKSISVEEMLDSDTFDKVMEDVEMNDAVYYIYQDKECTLKPVVLVKWKEEYAPILSRVV
jgi:hypothetical protein